MGWVIMSERELNRVEVLAQVDDGRLSVDNAANVLDLTRRQIFWAFEAISPGRCICHPASGAWQTSEQSHSSRQA